MNCFNNILSLIVAATCLYHINVVVGSAIDVHDLVIPTEGLHLGLRKFSVTLLDTNYRDIPIIANLQFSHDREYFASPQSVGVNDNGTIPILAWGILANEGWIIVSTSLEITNVRDGSMAFLSGSLQSAFLNVSNTFVHTPTNQTHGQLIINPTNANEYAFDNQLYYASSLDARRMAVPVAVRVNRDIDSLADSETVPDFVPCMLDYPLINIHIPATTYDELLTQLEHLGVRVDIHPDNPNISQFVVRNVTDAVMATMPSIQFFVRTDEGERLSIAVLTPQDYIGPENVLEDPSARPFWVRIGCNLPSMLLNRMVVHVDGINRRIGFGEPLNEF